MRTASTISFSNWRDIFWARKQLIFIDQFLKDNGLAETRKMLDSATDAGAAKFSASDSKHIVRTIRRAARISIGHSESCLRRSLLLWWVLKQLHVETTLRVGVSSKDGALSGHAWVELDNRPLNDRPNVRDSFKVIDLEAND